MDGFGNPQQNIQQQLAAVLQSYEQLNRNSNAMGRNTANGSNARTIDLVNGLDGAKSFLKDMPRSSSAVVFNSGEEAVFYMLSVDANGVPAPIKVGHFTLEDLQEETPNVVTKKDLDDLRSDIMKAIAAVQQKPQYQNGNQNRQGNRRDEQ